MNWWRQRGRVHASATLAATILLIGRLPAQAQDNAVAAAPAESPLDLALATTRTRGAETVAVFTDTDQPASVQFWEGFRDGAWARANRGLVQVVNVSKTDNPDVFALMNVSRVPTVVVYARRGEKLVKLGAITDCDSPEGLSGWLRALELGRSGQSDTSVTPTIFGGDVRPSPQFQATTPVPAPPVAQTPQPQQQQVMMVASQPGTTSAAVVQVPSQNLMIQQAPPQIFLAPQASPMVYVPQVASAAPVAMPTLAMAPSAPAANLFMATATVAPTQPAQQPTLAVAAPASAPATLALAAGGPALAVNNQSLSLASTGTRSRVRVRGPGLLNSGLARFGERLTRLGRTRIESVQETTLEAPVSQGTPTGLTTISTTSAAPIVPQQQPTICLQPEEEVCRHKCKRPCRHREHAPCQHEPEATCPPPLSPGAPSPQGNDQRLLPTPQEGPSKN